jgi:hypothetical protein
LGKRLLIQQALDNRDVFATHIAGSMLCLGWQFVQVPLNSSLINYYFRFNTLVLVEYVIFSSTVETLHCQNNSRQFLRFLGNKSSGNKLEPQITFDFVKKCKINNENILTYDTDISGNI